MAAATASKGSGSFNPDTDVHITYEDQQKINKFARQNARLEDMKDELKSKEKRMQNLEDASEELLLMDIPDSDYGGATTNVVVPYMLGEVFVSQSLDETQTLLEQTKERLKREIEQLQKQCDAIKTIMSDLKVQLYAKFGNNINLDGGEE